MYSEGEGKKKKKQRVIYLIYVPYTKGKDGNNYKILFSWASNSLPMVTAAMELKDFCSLEEKLWQT